MPTRLVSLNIGQPAPLAYRFSTVQTAFGKRPVAGPLRISPSGIDGDAQADLSVHGGPAKVACVFPSEHYPVWESRLGRKLEVPAFGENFTTEGLLEHEVCIGDRYRAGSALLEVSQPRQPCYKLATWNSERKLALWLEQAGQTGFYFRCIEAGEVAPGDAITLVDRPHPQATIDEANRVMHTDKLDREGLQRLLALEALSDSWRETFVARLDGIIESTARRLDGPG
ncbi:MAG: MOSC domain-containing protein [Dehalococcoidia bacterium]